MSAVVHLMALAAAWVLITCGIALFVGSLNATDDRLSKRWWRLAWIFLTAGMALVVLSIGWPL
ncbi:hypothetical protein ACFQ1E_08050 [Sphingomonas canadensis]|uniref:Uncharacterized protein n=1 Tax=Sphingomonas canadensis TaxID=1219257 RepID=A0ABW3HAG1_9SPHN|nr:hypothetical protein [Sphingomonas canadensis]MCW3835988.1 hypothetical protein [Sphingomonas canadensis]